MSFPGNFPISPSSGSSGHAAIGRLADQGIAKPTMFAQELAAKIQNRFKQTADENNRTLHVTDLKNKLKNIRSTVKPTSLTEELEKSVEWRHVEANPAAVGRGTKVEPSESKKEEPSSQTNLSSIIERNKKYIDFVNMRRSVVPDGSLYVGWEHILTQQ